MISEKFTDVYRTEVIVRRNTGHDHVQLLLVYADGSEPTSYGFTVADFRQLIEKMQALDAQLVAAGEVTATAHIDTSDRRAPSVGNSSESVA